MQNKLWIILLCIVSSCEEVDTEVPYYDSADFTPIWKIKTTQKKGLHQIGSFSFINQYGAIINNETVKGKIFIATFFFTACPSVCPRMNKTLSTVYQHFKGNSDVLFLSHSVMPEADSVSILYEYSQKIGVNSNQWNFLTGNKADIYNIARQSYFAEREMGLSKDSSSFLHTENMILVDEDAHIRGIYNGTLVIEASRMIEDIEILLKEKNRDALITQKN